MQAPTTSLHIAGPWLNLPKHMVWFLTRARKSIYSNEPETKARNKHPGVTQKKNPSRASTERSAVLLPIPGPETAYKKKKMAPPISSPSRPAPALKKQKSFV
jgi:hypothetical protein